MFSLVFWKYLPRFLRSGLYFLHPIWYNDSSILKGRGSHHSFSFSKGLSVYHTECSHLRLYASYGEIYLCRRRQFFYSGFSA